MPRFLIALALLSALPFPLRASGPAFLSEAAWAGSSASIADEWVEICGAPGTDLSGWSLSGAAAADIVLPTGAAIGPDGTYVISNYAAEDAKSVLAAPVGLVTTAIALSNSNLALTLRDADGTAVDAAGSPGSVPPAGSSGDTKATMERVDASLDGTSAAAWTTATSTSGFDVGITAFGTPGTCAWQSNEDAGEPTTPEEEEEEEEEASETEEEETPPTDSGTTTAETGNADTTTPEPQQEEGEENGGVTSATTTAATAASATSTSETQRTETPEPMAAVRVSEIYPTPATGEREWLELVNRSALGEIVDGWSVEDDRGVKTRLAGLIPAWGHAVIEAPKGSLNNGGDTVVLRDGFGRELDRVTYPKVAKGESYMRLEMQDSFAMTLTPTRAAANRLTTPEPPEEDEEETAKPAAKEPAKEKAAAPVKAAAAKPAASAEKKKAAPAAVTVITEPSEVTAAPAKKAASAAKTSAPKKAAAKPKAAAAPKYKGDAYEATVAVPTGVYGKTRAYILRDGALEELRVSKALAEPWTPGDRITFIAQVKTEGAASYLLANPNSVQVTGSASATAATAESWPTDAGLYRFTAEVVAARGDAVEVRLGGVEGDVLTPAGVASSLKPGDRVRIEGFVSPGARPRMVLASARGLTLEQARAESKDDGRDPLPSKLPVPLTVGLTLAAAGVGLAAYLRAQRIKRLELASADAAWE